MYSMDVAAGRHAMNPKNHRRFFAFGCSFTNYYWPTWANIIAQDIPEHYNYGQMAAGNTFIFHQLVEAHVRHKFTPDDLIMIMWSVPLREDRYVDRWHLLKSHPTAFGRRGLADAEYYKKYCSEYGSVLRDLTNITAAIGMLENTGCQFHMMAMQPFTYVKHTGAGFDFNFHPKNDEDILLLTNFFSQSLSVIKSSMYETVFNCNWSRKTRVIRPDGQTTYTDWHPLPLDHLSYLDHVFPNNKISAHARNYARDYHERIVNNQPFPLSLTDSLYVQLCDLKGQKISWADGS